MVFALLNTAIEIVVALRGKSYKFKFPLRYRKRNKSNNYKTVKAKTIESAIEKRDHE